MGLTKYKEKRNFDESPEPQGGKPDNAVLRFVVQKHDASRLHYDFRLEMEDVLKSWAVPKGPSMDTSVKRLAMMVEDHPYDYRNFEGLIPSGYGAGTVIVWDEGTYEAIGMEGEPKKIQEKQLLHQLHAGKIKIVLHGEKLKGEFALVKAYGRGENSWLLMKMDDELATKTDILEKDKSVLSGKTLEQMEKDPENIYGKNTIKHGETKKEVQELITPDETEQPVETAPPAPKALKELLKAGKRRTFPTKLTPMLATLVDKPFDNDEWTYEVKWDGYRAVAFMNGESVELKSRNDKSFNEKFYPVYDALKAWGINAVIDGEVVVTDENGMSNFGDLQNWRSEADGDLLYFAFDIMWYEGKDLIHLPLLERREILRAIAPGEGIIRVSDSFDLPGTEFFATAKEMGLEGIIAKKKDSLYYPGARVNEWLKIKANRRHEVVIGGYTINDNTSKPFSALLVGVFENGRFVYTGKIGTGFKQKEQREMLEQFRPLIRKTVPFSREPDYNKPSRFRPNPPHATVTWLEPELVCEVSFTEMTSDDVMRHPSFEGMRIDKQAKDVSRDVAKPAQEAIKEAESEDPVEAEKQLRKAETKKKMTAKPSSKERKTLLNPTDEMQVRKISGRELKFPHLSKIYWPDEHITKRDMLNYYYQVAPFILPYLKDRPQSLNRFPNGIEGHSFYQKDVTGKVPDWIETYLYHSEGDNEDKHFLVPVDEASVLYMASLGCIEMNPWSSRVQSPDNPDFCILDLDPDKQTFEQVIETAQVTKSVLDELGVESYCKTSGSTGLHIYIPLGAQYDYEQSKEFARVLVTLVHQRIPEFTTLERAVKDRKGKMYLDFLQNRPQATIASAYSLRPKPGATVSMPLHWDEVRKGLKMADFTIKNAVDRVRSEGDLFKPVLGKGIDMEKVITQFND